MTSKNAIKWPFAMFIALAAFCIPRTFSSAGMSDTLPPVATDFTSDRTAVDTAREPARIEWCVRAQDDMTGMKTIQINMQRPGDPPRFFSARGFTQGSKDVSLCATAELPRYAPEGLYGLYLILVDGAGNRSSSTVGAIENRQSEGLSDADGDGVPDDADLCPNTPNSEQTDADRDLAGDACDPFPQDRDNEQAQCEADRDAATASIAWWSNRAAVLEAELAQHADSDSDGKTDATDACPGTPAGGVTDASGCSLLQFCRTLSMLEKNAKKTCPAMDWKNDEPLTLSPKDCLVDTKKTLTTSDDLCLPAA